MAGSMGVTCALTGFLIKKPKPTKEHEYKPPGSIVQNALSTMVLVKDLHRLFPMILWSGCSMAFWQT